MAPTASFPNDEHAADASETHAVRRDGDTVRLSGDLHMETAASFWRDLRKATNDEQGHIIFDMSKVDSADGGVIALVVGLREELRARGIQAELSGGNAGIEAIVRLYSGHSDAARYSESEPERPVARLGRAALELRSEILTILDFIGNMVLAAVRLVRSPRSGHWRELAPLCENTGANAVPIVVLINFLVGAVMAFQSAKQLKLFGANVYVADLVGISLTRELAPLMTAIIVCGRSGAAFAAEVASMKVDQEIDALRTLGLSPFSWLVVPRLAALVIVVPLLTLIADFVGILGGLLVGVIDLGLTPQGYWIETLGSVQGWDILTGLMKSLVFSAAIALIACQQGFAASGGAAGVGRRTTSSVVATLFTLVSLDALLTITFRTLNI